MAVSTLRGLASDAPHIEWNPDAVEEGNDYATAAVEEARRRFLEHRRNGGTVLEKRDGESYKQVSEFNPDAKELVLIPRVAGG